MVEALHSTRRLLESDWMLNLQGLIGKTRIFPKLRLHRSRCLSPDDSEQRDLPVPTVPVHAAVSPLPQHDDPEEEVLEEGGSRWMVLGGQLAVPAGPYAQLGQ